MRGRRDAPVAALKRCSLKTKGRQIVVVFCSQHFAQNFVACLSSCSAAATDVFHVVLRPLSLVRSVSACRKAVEDLLLALTRVPQAVPQMIQTVVPFFSQVRSCDLCYVGYVLGLSLCLCLCLCLSALSTAPRCGKRGWHPIPKLVISSSSSFCRHAQQVFDRVRAGEEQLQAIAEGCLSLLRELIRCSTVVTTSASAAAAAARRPGGTRSLKRGRANGGASAASARLDTSGRLSLLAGLRGAFPLLMETDSHSLVQVG